MEQKQEVTKDELGWRCPVCGFHYEQKESAEECRDWCTEHQSRSLTITEQAVENRPASV